MRILRANSRGPISRSLFWIGPALLIVLGGAGVAYQPSGSIAEARQRLQEAAERAGRFDRVTREIKPFLDSKGFEQIAAAEEQLSRLIPSDVGEVEVFSTVRLAARAARVELTSISVGGLRDPELPTLSDQLLLREVSVAGRGTLSEWMELLSTMKGHGHPIVVLGTTFGRSDPGDQVFDARMNLGLIQSFPAPPSDPSAGLAPDESED